MAFLIVFIFVPPPFFFPTKVDYIIIKPLPGYSCDMKSSFSKYWKPRTPLDVGHRGAGNSTTTAKYVAYLSSVSIW